MIGLKKYIFNCFILLIPVVIWNIALYDYLPFQYQENVFWKDIPDVVSYGEKISRVIVFALPLFMVLAIKSRRQKIGLIIYLLGIITYFSSWICVINSPTSAWSLSIIGFLAPAYTTLIWFIGIGLIGNVTFLRARSLQILYFSSILAFVIFHTIHTYLVYLQIGLEDLN
jgi:hypothetical protein